MKHFILIKFSSNENLCSSGQKSDESLTNQSQKNIFGQNEIVFSKYYKNMAQIVRKKNVRDTAECVECQ